MQMPAIGLLPNLASTSLSTRRRGGLRLQALWSLGHGLGSRVYCSVYGEVLRYTTAGVHPGSRLSCKVRGWASYACGL